MSAVTDKKFPEKLKAFFCNPRNAYIAYVLLAILAAVKQNVTGHINNYLIFKYVYWHTVNGTPLYIPYLEEYGDTNHYGPFFSVIIAPFALLPDAVGSVLWNIAITLVLIAGINQLTLKPATKAIIMWICAHELFTALVSFQFNVASVGLILLSFAYLEKRKEFLAALTILIGFFVKLYGVVGLAFFFFVKRKWAFIFGLVVCFVAGLALPMLLSSPSYQLTGYKDWLDSLTIKNELNKTSEYADLSLFGFFSRALHIHINIALGVLAGMVVLLLALARRSQHTITAYRYMILNYLLLCLVMLNTNVESPTYIIGFVGVAIWFMQVEKTGYTIALFVFAVILTTLSPSDIFPKFIRDTYVRPLALKALPCILIFADVIFRLLFADFKKYTNRIFSSEVIQTSYAGN